MNRILLISVVTALITSCGIPKNTIIIKGSKQKFTSIQQALDSAGKGHTIIIGHGEYASDKEIWVTNDSTTIIGKHKPKVLCTNMQANVFWIDGRNVKIKNIVARHIKPDFFADCDGNVFTVDVADGVIIEKSNINGCGRVGVYVQGGVHILLKHNFIHDNTISAINVNGQEYFEETSNHPDIIKFKNNRFKNNGPSAK